jgi:thiol-disulfide isomerase/thioredoxin
VLRRYLGIDRWVRRALGVATLAALVTIGIGRDRDLFARAGVVQTASAEELLITKLGVPRPSAGAADGAATGESLEQFAAERASPALGTEGGFPEFAGATAWINSQPLSPASLRGKVVLVDFWTFGCYNCLNALPHVKALEAKYRDRGLVVIGVHTPEFPHEKVEENVRRAVHELGVVYPVVMDNDYRIWNAFGNQYWPAAYFIDATGTIRYHHFGEGRYDEQEQVVEKLLAERPDSGCRPSGVSCK